MPPSSWSLDAARSLGRGGCRSARALRAFETRGRGREPVGRERLYRVMQWVDGVPLDDWAEQRRVTWRRVLRLMGQRARALATAHRPGTHRDVKGRLRTAGVSASSSHSP